MTFRFIDFCRLARAAALSSVLLSGIVPAAAAEPPKIWLNHFKLGTLADAPDEDWPVTRSGLDTAFFGINTLWPLKRPFPLSIPPETAARTVAKLHANGIRIGVECGYFDHPARLTEPDNPASDVLPEHEPPVLAPGIGEHTARVEIAKLRSIWQAGHPPDFIMLDDPMRRLTVPGQDLLGQVFTGMADYAAAAREVCAYMKTMRRQFPAVKFVVVVNFPNWGWKGQPAFLISPNRPAPLNWGDAHTVLDTLFAAVKEAGEEIHAIQGDFPWRYYNETPANAIAATVDWPGRIRELEHYARQKGVGFTLVANSEAGYLSAKSFSSDSLKFLDTYLADGGRPDFFVVQSWYPHPQRLLPESDPDSCAWLCARFIERLREIHAGSAPVATPLVRTRLDRAEPAALLSLLRSIDPASHPRLAAQAGENWLKNTADPPVEVAARELQSLRDAVARASAGKPKLAVVLEDEKILIGHGQPAPPAPAEGEPVQWLVQVSSVASRSMEISAWLEGSTAPVMEPVWVARGSWTLLAVAVDPALVQDGRVTLCIGKPGETPLKTAIPVAHTP